MRQVILWLLAGLGLLFGLGSAETKHFEDLAARDIRAKLQGPHAHVQVQTRAEGFNAVTGHLKRVTISASDFSTDGLPLFTEPHLSRAGKIDDLRIELKDFKLGALQIQNLESAIPDCRYDFGLAVRKGRIRLSESGVGVGSVTITAPALEAFILHKFHEIKSVHVEIKGGSVKVSGYGEFLIIHTHFEVTAGLGAVKGTQLVLSDAVITFDGKPADEYSRKALLDVLNPVVDLDRDLKLYGAIEVSRITLEGDVLKAEGKTRIPASPESEPLK